MPTCNGSSPEVAVVPVELVKPPVSRVVWTSSPSQIWEATDPCGSARLGGHWTAVSSRSLAKCPNSELRRRTIGSSTGPRPVREETSVFRTWSCRRILDIWRWNFMWKASSFLSTACVLACILSHNCHRLISVSCKLVLSAIIIIIIIILLSPES